MIYESVNAAVLQRVPQRATSLLDLGCGAGAFGNAAKARTGGRVVGVTCSTAEAELARTQMDQVVVADLDAFDPAPLGVFDCVVCSHVLEHLRSPQRLLALVRPCLAPGGQLLVALPNVLHWRQRWQFLRGRFRYTRGGLMDDTHLRFYDWHSAAELITAAGYRLIERAPDGALPLSRLLGAQAGATVDRRALSCWPGLLAHQFVLSAVVHAAHGKRR